MIGFNVTTDGKKIKPNDITNIPTGKRPLIGLFWCSLSEMETAATPAPSVVKTMNYPITNCNSTIFSNFCVQF